MTTLDASTGPITSGAAGWRTGHRAVLIILGLVLAAAVLLAALPKRERVYFTAPTPLSNMMAPPPAGWQWEDRALGSTEAMTKAVADILQFDQAFYRVYRKGAVEVGVYVAYWKPGKIDPGQVVLHTPDFCWVANGATCEALNDSRSLQTSQNAFRPGHSRIFRWPQGDETEVIYWHVYGGRSSGLPVSDSNRWLARWRECLLTLENTAGGTVRRDQAFVRVSTNRSLDALLQSDLWPTLVRSLAPLGLVVNQAGQ